MLTRCLLEYFQKSSEPDLNDIDQAIDYIKPTSGSETIETGPGGRSGDELIDITTPLGRSQARFSNPEPVAFYLGRAYVPRSEVADTEVQRQEDQRSAVRAFKECFATPEVAPMERLMAGCFVAQLYSVSGQWNEAVDTWRRTLQIVPSLSSRSLSRQNQINVLQNILGIGRVATSHALSAGEPPSEALKLLGLGSGVMASFLLEAQVDVSMLSPDQASAFIRARSKLEAHREKANLSSPLQPVSDLAQWVSASKGTHMAEQELRDIITSIQADPKTENFLRPQSLDEVRKVLGSDTIVVVNASERCDAFLINNKSSEINTVRPSSLTWDDVE